MRQLKMITSITSRDSASVEKYLQEISKIPMITPEEEVILGQKIKAGDMIARDKLAKANLRFVVSVAKQYQNQGLSLPDLINTGNEGLLKAASRFDETKGFKFISYGVWWIRKYINAKIANTGTIVRYPTNKIKTNNKINRANSAFQQSHEREPTHKELSEIMGIDETVIEAAYLSSTRHISLDAPVHEAEDISMGDNLEDDAPLNKNLTKEGLMQEIQRSLKSLSQRESDVVSTWFGFGSEKEKNERIELLKKKYGITKEAIRQIKERAIDKLRAPRHKNRLKSYL